MTTILTKKKDTTGAPAPGDLTNSAGGAELAVNTFDKRLYTKDSGGNIVEIGTNPSTIDTTTVDTTNLEVTNIKAKDGTASATIANSTGVMTIASAVLTTADINGGTIDGTTIGASTASTGRFSDLTDTGLTSGRVIYAGTGGNLVDDADFTFNGTTVTMANDASISGLTVGKGGGAVSQNTVVGSTALFSNTTGNFNSAFGLATLYTNTTGSNNTAYGWQALALNTTASNNTAVGYQAGYTNSTGTALTAIGTKALYTSTAGINTAIGYNTLQLTTTGIGNTAVGGGDATTYNGTLYANTTGSYNTGLGFGALQANTTASNNTAVGYQAGYSNTTGTLNASLGYQAGYGNTTGAYNVFLGAAAGNSNTTSANNTMVGGYAGALTTGANNTFMGQSAGYYVTTGATNTFIGVSSGVNVTTGSKNTILGSYNGNQGGLDIRTASNYIVLSDGDGNPQATMYQGGSLALSGATPKAGTGITFPATQSASSDANTLDDYEEGTFTPVIVPGAGSITTQTCSGKYTKVGRVVTIYVSALINNPGTASGTMTITGLPFVVPDRSCVAIVREDNNTGFAYMFVTNTGQTSGVYFTLTTNGNPPYLTNNILPFVLTYLTS